MSNKFHIVKSLQFNYEDDYWNLFKVNSQSDSCEIAIDLQEKNEDYYSVGKIPVQSDGLVFCVSDSVLSVNNDFTKGIIFSDKENVNGIYGCAMVLLYGNFIRQKTLVIHGSLVDYHGKGIIFTGPSGAGKTTQAELWKEYSDADIINGDMVFLHKEKDGKFYAYGSPWHGSSDYCINRKVPVEGIFSVKKSDFCKLNLLEKGQKLQAVFSEVMLPDWFDGCKCLGLDTLDELLKTTPIYSFECTKDKNAVEIIEKMFDL